ncbi:MAG: phosphoribosylaminoimidazolecarboxamide formyltransferase [Saccharofermentanales bacterium]
MEMQLKYGCNPNQTNARVFSNKGRLPFEILSGKAGYINLLDALNAWQLVKELSDATGLPSATSFKHVSPAGAALGIPFSDSLAKAYFVDDLELSPLAYAYARARGADRMSSFGDFIALSETVDVSTAKIIAREVSDGIIAPDYEPEALEILKRKRKGNYCILKIDKDYIPEEIERKDLFGVTFEQTRNNCKIDKSLFNNIVSINRDLTDSAINDLLLATITLKYTQSNSVCYALDGQAIGIGAGQQSRIHCTRLAGSKADTWFLRQHPEILNLEFVSGIGRPERDNAIDQLMQDDAEDYFKDNNNWINILVKKPVILSKQEKLAWIGKMDNVSLSSDAFFPFGDNIDRAFKSGVKYVAEAGGSVRDDNVIETCNKYGMVLAFTGLRLFHH